MKKENFESLVRGMEEAIAYTKGDTTGCVVHEVKVDESDLVYRLRKRAEIRRQITTRKSVQEGQPDRIADLLEEAADEIERLRK